MQYQGISGITYLVEDSKIASGGEGAIYSVRSNDNQVAKIFKPDKRNEEREDKLRHMVTMKLGAEELQQVTWPQDVIYDQNGFVGYVMPKLNKEETLNAIYSSGADNKFDLRYRLLTALNLCHALKTVHDMGQICGDLNPLNISVNLDMNDLENAFHVTLVDTDSYHFVSPDGKTYRCEVGLADYIAPEVQKKMESGLTLRTAPLPTYTKETDLFALAVHVFTLLMNGSHPFACAKDEKGKIENTMEQMDGLNARQSVVAPQPIENIRDGFFPFYEKREGITPPVYAPDFSALPERLQNLFIKTFIDGYRDPSKRADAQEWIDALEESFSDIKSCDANDSHYYFGHNRFCPLCAVEEKIRNLFLATQTPPSDDPPSETQTTPPTPPPKVSYSNQRKEKRGVRVASIVLIAMLVIGVINDVKRSDSDDRTVVPTVEEQLGEEDQQAQDSNMAIESGDSTADPAQIAAQEKLDKENNNCLKYGNKIITYIEDKKYEAAMKLIRNGYEKSYLEGKEKIYIQQGELVDRIESGKGFVYYVWDDYAYLGNFEDGKPSGKGKEVGDPDQTAYGGYYTINGTFKNGYPNGKCTVYYSKYNSDSSATFIGKYKNGWENGSFTWINKNLKGGHSDTYRFSSDMGTRKVLEMYDGKYVYAKADSGWMYYSNNKGALKDNSTEHHGKK